MRIEVPHRLDRISATERLRELAGYWQEKYGVTPAWTGDTAAFTGSLMGFDFEVTFTVEEHGVRFEGPEVGLVIRRQVAGYVTRKLEEYLDPSASPKVLAGKRAELRKRSRG